MLRIRLSRTMLRDGIRARLAKPRAAKNKQTIDPPSQMKDAVRSNTPVVVSMLSA
jgi:hypothetical protein